MSADTENVDRQPSLAGGAARAPRAIRHVPQTRPLGSWAHAVTSEKPTTCIPAGVGPRSTNPLPRLVAKIIRTTTVQPPEYPPIMGSTSPVI